MWYYWTDERYQIIYSKCVTHAMKMVDSCSRENGVLCVVARSWLLFLQNKSELKNFELIIAWGVDELHQTFWFEYFNGKLCCKIHDLLSVLIIFFWIEKMVCSVLSLDECLIKINYRWFCVCFWCLEKVILWSHLCLAKDKFRYHHWHVYLILLSGMSELWR